MDQTQPLRVYFTDSDEWAGWTKRSDPVLHVELRKIASILVVAPLSANTEAKFAHGLADNLLSCIFRAWDFSKKEDSFSINGKNGVFLAPAMNTFMWNSPLTLMNENVLRNVLNCTVFDTVEKTLMCGDTGKGAMISIEEIVKQIKIDYQF